MLQLNVEPARVILEHRGVVGVVMTKTVDPGITADKASKCHSTPPLIIIIIIILLGTCVKLTQLV